MRCWVYFLIVKYMMFPELLITFKQAMMRKSFSIKHMMQWLQYVAILITQNYILSLL